jgi:hypothetical protein
VGDKQLDLVEYIDSLGSEIPTARMPSQDELKRAFSYDPESGILYWRRREYEEGATPRQNGRIDAFNKRYMESLH